VAIYWARPAVWFEHLGSCNMGVVVMLVMLADIITPYAPTFFEIASFSP
jgi:hypothetical protein